MARTTKPLTDKEIKTAKPITHQDGRVTERKLFDGGGMYLAITPKGQKWWRLKYNFNGKERRISLGVYPTVSLADARAKREQYRRMIADGADPLEMEKSKKERVQKEAIKKANTFQVIAQKWWKNYQDQVSEGYHDQLRRRIETYLYPTLQNKPIDEITRLEIIEILEEIKGRELHEMPRRIYMILNKIFKYAVTHEYAPHNIIADIELKNILGKKIQRHYPTLTKEADIRGLLQAIEEYSGDYATRMALTILPFVFVRSHNIRHMEWAEIDFTTQEWIIPAEKMKTKEAFVLPLPHQVITLLKAIRENATSTRYVFPSFRSDGKPLSDNTLITALRRMGYTKEEFVPHSFRAMFSTIAYEHANREGGHSYSGEVIEALLAHKEPNKVKAAYNRSKYREPMRGLIQWYADYLEGVKYGKR